MRIWPIAVLLLALNWGCSRSANDDVAGADTYDNDAESARVETGTSGPGSGPTGTGGTEPADNEAVEANDAEPGGTGG